MRKAELMLLAVPIVVAPAAWAQDAPDGFEWRLCEQYGTSLLVPDGWHFEEKVGEPGGCTISKERKSDAGAGEWKFKTGLTVQAWQRVAERQGVAADEFAATAILAMQAEDGVKTIEEPNITHVGDVFTLIKFEYKRKKDEKIRYTMRSRVIAAANKRTGSLFFVVFEAPSDDWKDAWKEGAVMMKDLRLSLDY